MKHLRINSVPQSSLKGSKSAAVASRLAAKQVGVKFAKDKVIKHLNGKHRPSGSDDSPKARASRTPHLGIPTKGQLLLPKMPSTYVGRLSTVIDWHRQIGKIYREMRRHQIDPQLGTRLTYVANVGATLAKIIEEQTPQGISTPSDLSRLNDAELQQLEQLLAKAAGPRAVPERITLGADDGN